MPPVPYKLEINRARASPDSKPLPDIETRQYDTFAEAQYAALVELQNHWGLRSVRIRHVRRTLYLVEMVKGRFQQIIG